MPLSESAIQIFSSVKAWIEPTLEAVGKRLDGFDVRLRAIPAGAKGEDGKDADPEYIKLEVARAVAELPKPKDGTDGINGKDADPAVVQQLVDKAVANVERIPGPIGEPGPIGLQGPIGASGKDGDPGAPGRDADPAVVAELVDKRVALAVALIPPAPAGPVGLSGKDGDPGQNGRDGNDADPVFIEKLVNASVINAIAATADHPALKAAAAAVDEAAASINSEFVDMADELLRGLEQAAAAESVAAPSINVHVNAHGSEGASSRVHNLTREQTVIGTMISDAIRETMMLPVKPVYDDKGKLLYGQRVSAEEV